MHGANKKRPNDVGGVVRHFKRPADPGQLSKPNPTGAQDKTTRPPSAAAGNPSKRHRERLNTELDAVAALLPFESGIIARLDKLSVLRLAVSYLEAKTFFQVLQQRHYARWPFSSTYASAFLNPRHYAQEQSILKALGGFLLILNENGDIIYATENIETLLGFHQSDTLHQPIFDMVHSEDRDELRRMLCWNYSPPTCPDTDFYLPAADGQILMERQASVRFRCFLDNTCGFMRVDIRGRLVILESCLPHCYVASRPEPNFPIFGLIAVCIPLVMPSHVDASPEEPFLRSKHTLNFSLCSADPKLMNALEIDDGQLSSYSLYTFSDPRDLTLVSEAHKQVIQNGAAGLLVYRLISRKSQKTYWLQSSCRLMMKNGKPDSIACSHRLLTEYEGAVLLSKRSTLAAKVLVLEDNMSASTASMSLLYGTGMNQPSPSMTQSPLTVNDFRGRQQQAPGMMVPGQSIYGTKPSGLRFRSSGKRTRVAASKSQQQMTPSGQQSMTSVRQSAQQLAISPTAPLPSYLLYPHARQSQVSPGTSGLLPYYLPSDGSNQQPVYAQQTRQYNGQQHSLQQTITQQQQQATELQLHYHLHQHYPSPTPYYPNSVDNGGVTKQSLSPISANMQQEQQQQQSFSMESMPANHVVDPGAPFWLYSPNQAQSTLPIEHRSKSAFSIQEVTNTLLSQ